MHEQPTAIAARRAIGRRWFRVGSRKGRHAQVDVEFSRWLHAEGRERQPGGGVSYGARPAG